MGVKEPLCVKKRSLWYFRCYLLDAIDMKTKLDPKLFKMVKWE